MSQRTPRWARAARAASAAETAPRGVVPVGPWRQAQRGEGHHALVVHRELVDGRLDSGQGLGQHVEGRLGVLEARPGGRTVQVQADEQHRDAAQLREPVRLAGGDTVAHRGGDERSQGAEACAARHRRWVPRWGGRGHCLYAHTAVVPGAALAPTLDQGPGFGCERGLAHARTLLGEGHLGQGSASGHTLPATAGAGDEQHVHDTRADADAQSQLDVGRARCSGRHLVQGQTAAGRPQRGQCRVGVFPGRQQRVSRELHHLAAVGVDERDQPAEGAVEHIGELLGAPGTPLRQALGQGREARDVREQHGSGDALGLRYLWRALAAAEPSHHGGGHEAGQRTRDQASLHHRHASRGGREYTVTGSAPVGRAIRPIPPTSR